MLDYRRWALRLAKIGQALTKSEDLDEIIEVILRESQELTASDGASIYRKVENGEAQLKFEGARNASLDLPDQDFRIPFDRSSLAGYSAVKNQVLNVEDAYEIPEQTPYSFSRDFDEKYNYRTKSLLVVPLKNRFNEVQGVLQLINRKNAADKKINSTEILSYPEEMERMVETLGAQAGVALERAALEKSVREMLESIIETLVTALDRRDKTTSGHSRRLAEYAIRLARTVDESSNAPWKNRDVSSAEYTTLYYAGLLHDIGKIAVAEEILNKQNRLDAARIEAIRFRLAYAKATDQLEPEENTLQRLKKINQSGYIQEDQQEFLDELHSLSFRDETGEQTRLLSAEEHKHLSVKKGNLTPEERNRMEYHARATKEILENVNWTRGLERVPEVAAGHHETPDGSGYPEGKSGKELSLLTRILAVADIFESLTATDRPYRDAMSKEKAEEILREEASENQLDGDLVELFFEENIPAAGLTSADGVELSAILP